jgi:serine/threonine protein kinase
VIYRCPCGAELKLNTTSGGVCDHCSRRISPKALKHSNTNTVAWNENLFLLSQTKDNSKQDTVGQKVLLVDSDDLDANTLVGKRFGHFEIVAPLGHGGMGQVYRALDTSLQRYVAVKILRSGIGSKESRTSSSEQEIDKLLQEAVSQARVSHPNIVTIYYVGKQDGDPFLAMELMDGENLKQRISEGELPFNETARIGLQLAHALQASFQLDIIHGDIKPPNVLMSNEGTVKLSDFGMARKASTNPVAATGGTPNYIAPELLLGKPVSIQSDMYALGVTLYEMTFGVVPVEMKGPVVGDWIELHESLDVQFPSPWPAQVPESWKDLLARLLAKNPENRYDSYEELIVDLTRLQASSTVAARFLPRLIAASMDWATVLLVTIGFQTLLVLGSSRLPVLTNLATRTVLLAVLTFLPIILYTLAIYFWRQSLGRNLMHLRVVNQYGLKPKRLEIAVRSLLRMQFPWFVIFFMTMVDNRDFGNVLVAVVIVYVLSGLCFLVDIGWMLLSSGGRSLHDFISGTRVVLDTGE